MLDRSIGLVTALNPYLGYDVATALAAEALHSECGVIEIVRRKNLLSEEKLAQILDPVAMANPQGPS